MQDYLPKHKMFKHQEDAFYATRDKEYFALLWEMGTGKTKAILDTGSWLYAQGKIDAVLVISPNGLNRMWVGQCAEHIPEYIEYNAAFYCSQPSKKESEALCQALASTGLKIVAMNVEAFTTKKGVDFARNFLNSFRSLMVIDEVTQIKNPKAIRTKALLKLGVHAKYRRILTGTPVVTGPLDLYCPFNFLDSTILRTSSFYAFRNRYCIMREMKTAGRSFMIIQGYTNTDELQKLIAPHSYRVTKQDCLDLPEKLYSKRYVDLSLNQRKLYAQLKKEVVAKFNGMNMSAPLALTKLLRLQQIVGGFFVPDNDAANAAYFEYSLDARVGDAVFPSPRAIVEPIDKVNPRVEALIELLEETNGKVICWCRFRSEIEALSKRIRLHFGETTVVEYHGGVDNETRAENIRRFQDVSDSSRFFLGNTVAGGKGLTLTAANTVVYYSNSFSLEDRLQSEDRCHRIGQRSNVTYIDFIASNTLDEKIVDTLRAKKSLADLITGDANINEWI